MIWDAPSKTIYNEGIAVERRKLVEIQLDYTRWMEEMGWINAK